ncbi:helix-turn-helix transcriptional regulator [Hydrogenophaga taeniospiralis]|nr:helix-turn-helix transcriptional regulator [Hydrogenophaga taeniospiralis]
MVFTRFQHGVPRVAVVAHPGPAGDALDAAALWPCDAVQPPGAAPRCRWRGARWRPGAAGATGTGWKAGTAVQQATGLSPLQYVHHVRLEEAKQLLEGSEDSIEAIAGQMGYEDAGYFARLFKREVNLTPAQYRRRFAGLREVLQQRRTA